MKNIIKVLSKYKIFFLCLFVISFGGSYLMISKVDPLAESKKFVETQFGNALGMFQDTTLENIDKTNGFTTVLLMGIDSRELDFDGYEFSGKDRNVDTIIQAIYDYETNKIFLITIPRDTGYEIEEDCAKQGYDKAINRFYKYGQDSNCREDGIDLLTKYTEKITGFENNYYSLISFETYYEIFNVVGEEFKGEKGLWIDIPENVYEMYPVNDGYEYFELSKGYQFLNSEQLLRYARSRQNTSDFVRSRRQHIVLETLKNRLIKLGISSPQKIKDIYDSFRDTALYSKIDIEEVIAGLTLAPKVKNAKIYHIYLDDSLGGKNNYIARPAYSPPDGVHNRPGFYLTPIHYDEPCCRDDNYFKVKNLIRSIIDNPEVYDEEAKVAVYSKNGQFEGIPVWFEYWLETEHPIYNLVRSNKTFDNAVDEDVYIVDYSGGQKNNTLNYLRNSLEVKVYKPNQGMDPKSDEDIAIHVR